MSESLANLIKLLFSAKKNDIILDFRPNKFVILISRGYSIVNTADCVIHWIDIAKLRTLKFDVERC
jgi:hypothetical protein